MAIVAPEERPDDELPEVEDGAPLRHTWSQSDRFVPRAFVRPAQQFMRIETAGGTVLLVAAIVAMVWANSPWRGGYEALWSTVIDLQFGGLVHLEWTLHEFVNDVAMTFFFFVVVLEIKRELVLGELRDPKAAAVPVIGALGGMLVPVAIFLAINAGQPGQKGFGIPVATDIAFAVGILALLGRRVPMAARLFLLTLAIADDLGGILVIAVFYSTGIEFGWLAGAVLVVVVTSLLARAHVRSLVPYVLLGVACWLALDWAGVEPTLAGVAFGFITPAWAFHDPRHFGRRARRLIDGIDRTYDDQVLEQREFEENESRLREVSRLAVESESPLERLVATLNPWTSFLVVPVFALANAGVRLSGDALSEPGAPQVAVGVALGLFVGKALGVFSFTWLACRAGVGRIPTGARWKDMFGVSIIAGVGFTVALFITSISFTDEGLAGAAKIGIVAGSVLSGAVGYVYLRTVTATPRSEA